VSYVTIKNAERDINFCIVMPLVQIVGIEIEIFVHTNQIKIIYFIHIYIHDSTFKIDLCNLPWPIVYFVQHFASYPAP
jgi:hypothetical protein